MPFVVPQIAHSSYRELVQEALDRIPVHTPEWTNQDDHDPGVTLIQLFAHMTEVLNYRCNLIPERNRAKFLELLQVPLRPAQAARGLVAFSRSGGLAATASLPRETLLRAGRVELRTENAVSVLPVEGRLYLKRRLPEARRAEVAALYLRLYPDLVAEGATLDYYETEPFTLPDAGVTLPVVDLVEDTADAALWLALLARPTDAPAAIRAEIAHKVLTLGVLPAQDSDVLVLPPAGPAPGAADALLFQIPVTDGGAVGPASSRLSTPNGGRLEAGPTVRYERLEARPDADLLVAPGTVELRLPDAARLTYVEDLDPLEPGVSDLPPSLADTDDAGRLITWIRIRAPEVEQARSQPGRQSQLAARFSWIGINAARVQQRALVRAERLPDGTGEPDQRVRLVHAPVLPDSIAVAVNGEQWLRIDDLAAAGPEVDGRAPRLGSGHASGTAGAGAAPTRVYRLDPESGVISFGNGSFGTRPPRRATIVASYAYGGGRAGVVGIGAIDKGELPPGIRVTNPVPTWGGDEAERIADAEYRIPRVLRHRDRLVSAADFRDIAFETPGVDLGRLEVLPLFHPAQAGVNTPGVVTLLLIPRFDAEYPETPAPDRRFLDAVCRHLEPRRLITTELHLRGPAYRELWVSVGVDVVQGREQGPVLERAEVEVRRFLSPLAGGFDGSGWPLDKTVEPGEILATVARVDGVARVGEVLLGDADGNSITTLSLAGLELPRLLGVTVASGAALPMDDLRGVAPSAAPSLLRLPVPVVPEAC
jgi:hypothetical protein